MRPLHEPHKTKTIQSLSFLTSQQRKRSLASAKFNVFRLTQSEVTFDMASLGSGAMSQEQVAGTFLGDEAYAGARNFESLQQSVETTFGFSYLCPTHNHLGCVKLIVATLVPDGGSVPSNACDHIDVLTPREVRIQDVRDRRAEVFTGNVDLGALEGVLEAGDVSVVYVEAFADGQHPISLANLRAVRRLANTYGKKLVVDGSRIALNAWYIQQHESGQATRSIAELVKTFSKSADVLQVDGAQDPRSTTGGFLATDNPEVYERFMNEVVVYEGLHTYGGMTGRTMEVLARGVSEMTREDMVHWMMSQTERFTERLRAGGVPLERGCDGAYIRVDQFLPSIAEHRQDSFSAALYQTSGVRALAPHRTEGDRLVPVQIPRLAFTNAQLDEVADAIIALYEQREKIEPLHAVKTGPWRDQMSYRSILADLETTDFMGFPYRVHTFESIGTLSRERREDAIRAAGHNTFLLKSRDVTIDLLTDSGTSSMSTDQWASYMSAKATSATSDEYKLMVSRLHEITGHNHLIPTHQGRAAEHILSQIMIRPGQFVPGNMYFTTTKLHQEMPGGLFVDVIVDEAHQPESDCPWKGNIDLAKLRALVDTHGAESIAYVSFELSVNMAGGQPVSMDNLRQIYAYCSERGIAVFYDATRFVENAYMIQARDARYHNTSVRNIAAEMMLYCDGSTVSGKKDFLINIGGLLTFRDNEYWAHQAEDMLRIYEGTSTSGGLATADLAAVAGGVIEMLDDRYIRSRVRQTEQLGRWLMEAGIPIVTPPGSHAIFIDAKRFLPHIDQDEYPAQRLAAEIYLETGVRPMERGNVSKGRDPNTGENYRPALELVRLTIPRRVYSDDHMRAVADGIIRLYERRNEILGLRFVYEPKRLRFFQGRFELVS